MMQEPTIENPVTPPERVWLYNKHLAGVQCDVVEEFGTCLYPLIDKMCATMHAHDGVGLSAPQIGVFKRISVVHLLEEPGNPKLVMINPVILDSNGEIKMMEGCLSLPGSGRNNTRGVTRRAASVYFRFQDVNGETQHLQADGVQSVAVQHEIDHLSGRFFLDRIPRMQRKLILEHFAKSIVKANPKMLAERYLANAQRTECGDRPVAPQSGN